MKKLLILAAFGFFLSGCANMTESEFWKHDSLYKNWDHLKYSWGGHKNCDPEDAKKGQDQGWWGMEPKECEVK